MDALPFLGGGALAMLVVVIGYLLRSNMVDRQDCRRALADLEARYAVEVVARQAIQERIDVERERRRNAENLAWQLSRSLGNPETPPSDATSG